MNAENPIQLTISLIKGSQKARILWYLNIRTQRFSELQKYLYPVSKKVLSEQLKELENNGFIYRHVFPEVPVRVEYSITELGKSIKPIFDIIEKWQNQYRKYHSHYINSEKLLIDDYSGNLILELIGNKWKDKILISLNNQTKRFGELKKELSPISQKVLTNHLREMEQHGLIKRKTYSEIPPKVEYSLTELGKSLIPIIYMLYEWGEFYQTKSS